jgi:hypothetical protein
MNWRKVFRKLWTCAACARGYGTGNRIFQEDQPGRGGGGRLEIVWRGQQIVARIYEEARLPDAPVKQVAQKEVPLPYNRTLEQAALPQVEDVIAAVKEVLK